MEPIFAKVFRELGLDPESATQFMVDISNAAEDPRGGDIAFVELLNKAGITKGEDFYDGLFYRIYKKSQEHYN